MNGGKPNTFNEQSTEDPMPHETQTNLRDTVVAWLKQNNYTLSSFDRLISNAPGVNTYTQLNELLREFPNVFAPAKIKGGLPGLKLVAAPTPPTQEEPAFSSNDLSEISMPIDAAMPTIQVPDAPVGVVVPKTPVENVETLIAKAAAESNSSASENYAHAALLAAQAIYTMRNTVA
jgi:hypothetical protein